MQSITINTNRYSLQLLKDEVTINSFNESTYTSLSKTGNPLSKKKEKIQLELPWHLITKEVPLTSFQPKNSSLPRVPKEIKHTMPHLTRGTHSSHSSGKAPPRKEQVKEGTPLPLQTRSGACRGIHSTTPVATGKSHNTAKPPCTGLQAKPTSPALQRAGHW